MSVATAEPQALKMADQSVPPALSPINVTERAGQAVQRIINDQRLKCLKDLAPELADVYTTFNNQHGHAPTLAELASAAGLPEADLITKLGAAAVGKPDYMTQEQSTFYRELSAANGHPATSAELAARAGITEQELLTKLGNSAAVILGRVCLRVRVVGGGCSGFQHKLDLDPNVSPKLDDTFEMHGISIVVDKRSSMYLGGVQVDYHDELHRSGFSVSNPSAKTTCGCGSSFSM